MRSPLTCERHCWPRWRLCAATRWPRMWTAVTTTPAAAVPAVFKPIARSFVGQIDLATTLGSLHL